MKKFTLTAVMSLFCLISFAGTETIQLTLGEEDGTDDWKSKIITDVAEKIKLGDKVIINFNFAEGSSNIDYAICNNGGTKIVIGEGKATGTYDAEWKFYRSSQSEISFIVDGSVCTELLLDGMTVQYDTKTGSATSAKIERTTSDYTDTLDLTNLEFGDETDIENSSWKYRIVKGATYLLNSGEKLVVSFANTSASEQFAICDANGTKIYGNNIANTTYDSQWQCYTVNNGVTSISFDIDASLLAKIKKAGLRIEYNGLSNLSVSKEAATPAEPISNDVTTRFNNKMLQNNLRSNCKWTVGKKMSDEGKANIVTYGEELKYESCYIQDGSSYSFAAEDFSDIQPGDTLHVYVEKCANPDDRYQESEYDDKNDKETKDGEKGAWAGLRVGDGWLAPKQNCFAIKDDFIKVLDYQMIALLKTQGLRIEGCKFQLDYVFITKGEMPIQTKDETILNRIEGFYTLYDNNDKNSLKWSAKELKNTNIYWGDVIYVEYDKAGDAPEAKYSGANTINGNEIKGLRGKFFNSNGKKNRYFLPLDYQDTHNLLNLAEKSEDSYLEITAPNGVNITAVKILSEVRERNKQNVEANKALDWNNSEGQLKITVGQVEIGDKITITTKYNKQYGSKNSQFQASVMHTGEKNSKALAFNKVFKFADIYDVLTYDNSNGVTKSREFYDYWNGNEENNFEKTFTYTVRSQYMANQLSKFPLTINGQETMVTKIEVDSKAFVFPASIGLEGKPVYWGTMCSPYNIKVQGCSTHAWIVTGVDTENPKDNIYPINITEVHNIPAGTPVLISKDENVYGENKDDFKFAVADDKENFECDEIFNNPEYKNILIGDLMGGTELKNDASYTYYKLTYKNSKLDGTGDNITGFFKIADAGIQTAQFKTYLKVANGIAPKAKAFVFKFDNSDFNTPTGIESIETPAVQTEKVYYNLNGQRIGKPTKSGIYICNGKKVIIK